MKQIARLQRRDEADPLWFEGVLADITNGDSNSLAFAKLCREYDVEWGAVRNWVKADPGREQRYQDALAARAELRREKAAANVARVSQVEPEDVSTGDVLKAAAMVLDVGGKKGGEGVMVQINIGKRGEAKVVETGPQGGVIDVGV